jgi:hypothetical protein
MLELCAPPRVCDKNVCKLELGSDCQQDQDCKSRKCSAESKKCVLDLEGNCQNDPTMCDTRLACSNGICKLGTGEGPCDKSSQCASSLICDHQKLCKTRVGGQCSNGVDCVHGSVCEQGTCKCKAPSKAAPQLDTCVNSILEVDCTTPAEDCGGGHLCV